MSEKREKYLDRMIAIYGYENPIVLQYAHMCEDLDPTDWNDTILRLLVESHEADPYMGEDDED